MTNSFADKVIDFNTNLQYIGKLPKGFEVLNPYRNNPETLKVMRLFYHTFYLDQQQRKFIIGINPSRNGAGVTGVPFTDTKRLKSICGIEMKSAHTHELSSQFLYDMIQQWGGVQAFYQQFYIQSPFPLALIRESNKGTWLNANYYDTPELFFCLKDFMIETLRKHISLGLDTSSVFILGKKNAQFIQKLNKEAKLFDEMKILEHPRFIQQYHSKEKELYINKYIITLNS